MTTRRPLIAGNWKMNGLKASERELAGIVAGSADLRRKIDLMVCPPATLIMRFVAAAGGALAIGGQDCHAEPSGAFTGDVSAEMLADLGASAVIVGHSERRSGHGETDADVRAKLTTAGYEPAQKNTPRQFGAFIAADTTKWVDLVAKTNMKAN